mmetsp:Transcript_1024/g.1661  ORF Transcript_1024/g.1661 Transcript_1024/m.1661 type:complete len:265 (-) Transcript_1024:799-1593(-)
MRSVRTAHSGPRRTACSGTHQTPHVFSKGTTAHALPHGGLDAEQALLADGKQQVHTSCRRRFVLQSTMLPLAALWGSASLSENNEQPPPTGTCPTCIGVVDGTLGSCAGLKACMSSYDDRPGFFIAPWSHEERGRAKALDKVEEAVTEAGGEVVERTEEYLRATFSLTLIGWQGTTADDVEFLLPEDDTTVELRGAARNTTPDWTGRIERRFEELRNACGFEIVPVLRNRNRVFGVGESPFDTFGPAPPTDLSRLDALLSGAQD